MLLMLLLHLMLGYGGGGRSGSKDFLLIPMNPGTDRRMHLADTQVHT